MAKPIKISDQGKEWFLRSSHRSQPRLYETRTVRKYILIVCEGTKTEPNYFEAFKNKLPKNTVNIHGGGSNTLSLVDMAQRIKQSWENKGLQFDQIWVVFDRDSFEPSNFDNAIRKAESDGMKCAWSNEAFELWYILHFENRITGMNRDEYKGKLSDLLNETYKKNDSEMYEKLKARGNQERAMKWAKSLHDDFKTSGTPPSRSNPCTTVYELVEALNKFIV